tara:strand:- start:837 stop:1730 length:894 start_codon:yes stop_codon:yes gene_type:complete
LINEISIVIPSLNEEESIPSLISEIDNELSNTQLKYEIIIVDDGSKVSLDSIVPKNKNLKIFRNLYTKGQSQSLLKGIENSEFKYICVLDGDGQNPPFEIKNLIDTFNSDYKNIDAVCGFRKNRKDKFLRSLYSKIANFFIRKLLKSNIKDLGCSLKLFRKNLIEEIRFSGDMHRMLSVLFEYRGHRIIQIPVVHKERKFGETKYGLNRLIPVFVDSFLIYLSEGFTLTPRYSLSKLAFYSFMASFLLISYSAFQKFAYEIFVHRNPIFLIGLTFLFISIQLFVTSVISFFIENNKD